jgi:hypothetical protein
MVTQQLQHVLDHLTEASTTCDDGEVHTCPLAALFLVRIQLCVFYFWLLLRLSFSSLGPRSLTLVSLGAVFLRLSCFVFENFLDLGSFKQSVVILLK